MVSICFIFRVQFPQKTINFQLFLFSFTVSYSFLGFSPTLDHYLNILISKYMMASFSESIEALKEAGLADLEILEIMSDSIDGKINRFLSIPKTNSNNSLNNPDVTSSRII